MLLCSGLATLSALGPALILVGVLVLDPLFSISCSVLQFFSLVPPFCNPAPWFLVSSFCFCPTSSCSVPPFSTLVPPILALQFLSCSHPSTPCSGPSGLCSGAPGLYSWPTSSCSPVPVLIPPVPDLIPLVSALVPLVSSPYSGLLRSLAPALVPPVSDSLWRLLWYLWCLIKVWLLRSPAPALVALVSSSCFVSSGLRLLLSSLWSLAPALLTPVSSSSHMCFPSLVLVCLCVSQCITHSHLCLLSLWPGSLNRSRRCTVFTCVREYLCALYTDSTKHTNMVWYITWLSLHHKHDSSCRSHYVALSHVYINWLWIKARRTRTCVCRQKQF